MKKAQKYAEELNLDLQNLKSKTKWQCKNTIMTQSETIVKFITFKMREIFQ